MTAWLIRRFIREPDRVNDPDVRAAYGTLAAVTGIAVNLLLSAGKFFMGLLSGSLAIMADAANNLSDAAGSIVTLITTRLARKPVDQEHPFGHGRMEYLGSLAGGVLILLMGLQLLRDGLSSILNPEPLTLSWVVVATLVASVLLKLWLFFFYRKLGNAVHNGTLLAASKDSLGDVKKLLDPSEVGGTPFLGISKPVLKAHGSSDARAIRNAVFRAVEYAQSGIIADVEAHIDVMKVEKNG